MHQFAVIVVFAAVAFAAELPYPKPSGYPAPSYDKQPLMPYNFGYTVKDDPTYNNFAHQETADTKAVTGSYRVALPDGRTQIVSYKADEYGYVADVKYEGEAKYPEYSKPAYKPAASQSYGQ
ncbi:pro-resilin [Daphnia magna]|uniref:Cuticular protein n=1 Tax=Daphnia magna TaxID=35525 RepID=A0A0P5XUG0_9CRUS|nr:pro-resilin [Daphnia magna]KZS21712.1 Cuticular protein [Daphnia magna]